VADIVNIGKSNTGLTNDLWVRRWGEYCICYVWLKVIDGGSYQKNVVSPSRDNWVRFNSCVAVFLEE